MKRIFVFVWFLLIACKPTVSLATSIPSTNTPVNTIPVGTSSPQPTLAAVPTISPTVPPSTVELEGAELPLGFSMIKFAEIPRSTAFAFDARGRLFVTSQDGNVYIVTDENQDGRADKTSKFASGYTFPLGVAIHPATGDVYVSHQGVISVLSDGNGDKQADGEKILVGDLPFGQHQNDNLEFGPDGWLYIGVGSTCDACDDTNPFAATILRINVDTGEKEIFATGLRNPFDIAFHPETGELFATDNGRDDLGMDAPFEELNHIVQGGDYGYPKCWDEGNQPGCENSIPAIAFFDPHSSADGVDFYRAGNFPAEYHGNAFVTIFGSWLKQGVQTGIQRVVLIPNGNTYKSETSWFIRFPQGAMPLPIVVGPDGAMYVGEYINGVIYRISYGMP